MREVLTLCSVGARRSPAAPVGGALWLWAVALGVVSVSVGRRVVVLCGPAA